MGTKLRKFLAVTTALTLTLSFSGCSTQSAEQACADYIKAFGKYLEDVMVGSAFAESGFANKLEELAKSAPQEIASAMRSDAMNVSDSSYDTASACSKYIKE